MRYGILNTIIVLVSLICLVIIILFNSSATFAQTGSNGTMKVRVDLIGFNTTTSDEISIDVPNFIDLGNLTKDSLASKEEDFIIGNTGTKNITVTPQLKDPDEEILNWAYFRNYKTSTVHPDEAIQRRIGNYSVNINKPATGKTRQNKTVYIQINLADFTGTINEDVQNYEADIVFIAVERL